MEHSVALAVANPLSTLGDLLQPTPAKPRISKRKCRVCGSDSLLSYLHLGNQPLANALRTFGAPKGDTYPLRLLACLRCKLSQLNYVVSPELMYTEYAYRSGVSAGWRAHCKALAEDFASPDAFMVDIASNDGTLVKAFAARGCRAVGVEPSQSFADDAYPKHSARWTPELAERLGAGAVDVLTAQNVLGHVDDVHDFMKGIKLALAPNGVCVIEVPYLGELLRTLAFDTIYHEHLSYWSVTALKQLANTYELDVVDVQPLAIHGGSIRVFIEHRELAHGDIMGHVTKYLVAEHHDFNKSAYLAFSDRVTRQIATINETLLQHTPYVGFGAAAKTTVMLNCLDVRAYPRYVYDDNEAKWGKLIPGTQVPVVATADVDWRNAPGPMCLFAWNWADGIIPRLRRAGYSGAIYAPLPKPRWDTVE